jgi:ankyrin repeat protein
MLPCRQVSLKREKKEKKEKARRFYFIRHTLIMSMSEFYYACRSGDVAKVKTLLSSMSTTDIDRIEPNSSTALHAAAYFGHTDIVRLLLDKGASRSQKNKYDKTPEEEAKTPEIAQLF